LAVRTCGGYLGDGSGAPLVAGGTFKLRGGKTGQLNLNHLTISCSSPQKARYAGLKRAAAVACSRALLFARGVLSLMTGFLLVQFVFGLRFRIEPSKRRFEDME